jgi:hypothetical protein
VARYPIRGGGDASERAHARVLAPNRIAHRIGDPKALLACTHASPKNASACVAG